MSTDGVLDDESTQIQYIPEIAWQLDTQLGTYGTYKGTVHSTTQVNATASVRFTGTSISVTCLLWPTGSNFTATLDDTLVGTYNTAVASISAATPRIIFTKSDLNGDSQHTLVLRKVADDPRWVTTIPGDELSHLHIDSISIVGGSASTPNPTSSSSNFSSPSFIPPGAIAGIVVAVVLLIALLVTFLWYHRRKARRSTKPMVPFVNPTPQVEEAKELPFNIPPSPTSTTATSSIPQPQPQVRAARGEKIGLPFSNQNEGPGSNSRSRWRASLFELPGHRVIRAQSRMPPPRTTISEEEGDTASSAETREPGANSDQHAIRFAPPPPLSMNTNSNPQSTGLQAQGYDRDNIAAPDTIFSPVSGPESHITESIVPPSSVPPSIPPIPETSISSPTSSRKTQATREKAYFHGPGSGTASSLPLSASTIPSSSISPSSASGVNTRILLRELAGLRDQVRHLTELHQGGGGVYTAGEAEPHEPPPEYVGRDSDEESQV